MLLLMEFPEICVGGNMDECSVVQGSKTEGLINCDYLSLIAGGACWTICFSCVRTGTTTYISGIVSNACSLALQR